VNASGPSQQDGLYLSSSSNNTLTNITSNYNSKYGFYLSSSSNNSLSNITANSNSQYGLVLSSSNYNNISSVNASGPSQQDGLYLSSSSNNTLTNITSNYNSKYGFYLFSSSNNALDNMSINSNTDTGIYLADSPNNTLTNITLAENLLNDIDLSANFDYKCLNTMTNITGSGNRPIKYFNSSVNLSNETLSELILCDADNSSVTNITIIGSANLKNNGIIALWTDYSNFTNINSSYRYNGFYLDTSTNNLLTNLTANYNDNEGYHFVSSSRNNLINITANSNNLGMWLDSSSNNTINNMTASHNANDAVYFMMSSRYNTINNSRLENNSGYGIYLFYVSSAQSPRYNTFYNNYLNNTVNLGSNNANNQNYWNTTLDCARTNIIGGPCMGGSYWTDPDGNFSDGCMDTSPQDGICDNSYNIGLSEYDYLPLAENPPQLIFVSPATNGSTTSTSWIFVNVSANETLSWCTLDWNNGMWQNVSMTATGFYCYVNMTSLSSGSYYFRVYGNDSTGHMNVTEDREERLFKGNCSTCAGCNQEIAAANPGETVNLTASINGQSGSCIGFEGKDYVTFDCLGNAIDGDDTGEDYGILLNETGDGSNNNTLKDCIVTGFYNGVYLNSSSNNTLVNFTASDNHIGMRFYNLSMYNAINDSRLENNTDYGLYFESHGGDYPRYNTLYNNYLNNSINLGTDNANNQNYWNTTLDCARTNIIGGPCMGGSYWTNSSVTEFSDMCADADGNGICDDSNTLGTNTDWLPLSPTPTTIILTSPEDTISTTDQIPDFVFNVSDVYSQAFSCIAYVNNGTTHAVGMNSSVLNDTSTTITSNMTLQDGTYTWWVNCTNAYSRVNQSEARSLTVDTTAPGMTIASPQNTTYTSPSIDLNATASETVNLCWWNIDSGENDTLAGSGTDWDDIITAGQGLHQLFVYCNDTVGNLGLNQSVWFTVSLLQVQNTRVINPALLVARQNETLNSTTWVKYAQGNDQVYMVNITSEVPYDFTAPAAGDVRVYFVDYEPYGRREITGNESVNVSVVDPGGGANILVMVNISNVSETSAGGYMEVNDSIEVFYIMNSSQMEPNAYRSVYTNATMKDGQSQTGSHSLLSQINSSEVVLRGYKSIWIPDLSNPQNLSVEIVIRAIGGPVSGILLSDYIPQGASINDLDVNVTYYNSSTGNTAQLANDTDYYVSLQNPVQDTLPDGTPVDIYYYNFSYNYTNWDGNLYDNDTITMRYNITVLGGGEWVLPAIISGYDPQYQKDIKTEMYADANVPSFDVLLDMITKAVNPGDAVKAVLRMLNVGGPRAKVDVEATYSIKTMEGGLITEGTDTFAVVEQKEKELSLDVPSDTKPGRYTFEAFVTYTGREAISTRVFEVLGPQAAGDLSILYILATAAVAAVVAAILLRGRKHD
jgi:parallel beta-helix repeat protein